MISLSVCSKVFTLSGFYCTFYNQKLKSSRTPVVTLRFFVEHRRRDVINGFFVLQKKQSTCVRQPWEKILQKLFFVAVCQNPLTRHFIAKNWILETKEILFFLNYRGHFNSLFFDWNPNFDVVNIYWQSNLAKTNSSVPAKYFCNNQALL